jgi:ATP-dependent DNA helicase RecG
MSQQVILGYIVDFYFPRSLVAIEVDGGYHETAEQRRKDQIKDKALRRQGIVVLRFSNEDIMERLEEVLLIINKECMVVP